VDVALVQTLTAQGWSYATLLERLACMGWFPHRQDRRRGPEDWHFNWFHADRDYWGTADRDRPSTWDDPGEAHLRDLYGDQMILTVSESQRALATLGHYSGAVDGQAGPLTRAAVRALRAEWGLRDGVLVDGVVQRLLAYLTADRMEVPL
jgi:hypothetical protein